MWEFFTLSRAGTFYGSVCFKDLIFVGGEGEGRWVEEDGGRGER